VEAREFREHAEFLRSRGLSVIGVSTDAQTVSDRFAESLDLPFPLVGDPDASIARRYGVKWPLLKIAKRVTFVVGEDRRVESVHRSERDPRSHPAHVCALAGTQAE
jgi:thioredoxin-dependent peroxiredoxin